MLYAITAVNAWHTTNTNRLCLHILQTHTHIQNQYLVYHSAAGAFILRQKKNTRQNCPGKQYKFYMSRLSLARQQKANFIQAT